MREASVNGRDAFLRVLPCLCSNFQISDAALIFTDGAQHPKRRSVASKIDHFFCSSHVTAPARFSPVRRRRFNDRGSRESRSDSVRRGQNVEAVGYSNLNDRPGFKMSIQKAGERWYLYVGMLWNEGWQIVDVTDPKDQP